MGGGGEERGGGEGRVAVRMSFNQHLETTTTTTKSFNHLTNKKSKNHTFQEFLVVRLF